MEDTKIVFLEIETDQWREYCLPLALESPDLMNVVYPSCGLESDSDSGTTGQTLTPGRATLTPEVSLINPCDAMSETIVESILGNPVDHISSLDLLPGKIVQCRYSHDEDPMAYFWVADTIVDIRELKHDELRGAWFREDAWGSKDFVIYSDRNGWFADLVAEGSVKSESGETFKVVESAQQSDLGSLVMAKRNGIPGDSLPPAAGHASVELMVKLAGYEITIYVTVNLTEPYDPDLPDQEERDAFSKAMPPIEEYERRALELAGFVARAAELAQLGH